MVDTLFRGEAALPLRDREAVEPTQPDLLEWLHSGRLTLVDEGRRSISAEDWPELPSAVRARVRAEFARVVRGSAKAAVIFLRA